MGKPEEIWKPIKGFERYRISNYGRVSGVRVDTLKWLYSVRGGGYPFVDLRGVSARGVKTRKLALIHMLVAVHFIGKRPKGLLVHHLDLNRKNPKVTNLMYVTPEENANPEAWRPVDGFDGYHVSNLGRVKSFKRKHEYILKIMTNRGGNYAFVGLYKATAEGPKRKLINVHNIVAATFLGEPSDPSMLVDHKNRIRCDARASNLRYVTCLENAQNRG